MKHVKPTVTYGAVLIVCCLLPLLLAIRPAATQPPTPVEPETTLGWQANVFGAYIMAMCADTNGGIWVGTEGNGVWRYQTQLQKWTQWTSKNGLGDDIVLSLACDNQGRIWAGHSHHGVSVWNGAGAHEAGGWKNYDVFNGPLGERVFDIAVNPQDGDVWMATNAGLARYHAEREWKYYHRGTGLPSDQINALSFGDNGTLYAATKCDGLVISSKADDYTTWRHIVSPFPKMPLTAAGTGLPSNVLNDVLVAKDGTVWAGTLNGLARSADSGQAWEFLRGQDWQARVDGLYDNPEDTTPAPISLPLRPNGTLLAEDYVSCLAEDIKGRLWVGHRRQGYEVRDPQISRRFNVSRIINDKYVRSLLPNGTAENPDSGFIGNYGGAPGGVGFVGKGDLLASSLRPPIPIPFPQVAVVPDTARLQFLKAKVLAKPLADAVYLGEDWATQGNWLGRYGQRRALFPRGATDDAFTTNKDYTVDFRIGPHFKPPQSPNGWNYPVPPEQRNVPFSPKLRKRLATEWNDGSWQEDKYPPHWEGPNLHVTVHVPEGWHRVSLYFCNYNGHDNHQRYRDYVVELKKHEANRDKADAAPVLARGRVQDFWSGCYQNFAMQGPGDYEFKITRHGSFVVMLQGVLVNRLDDAPAYGTYAPPLEETIEDTLTASALDLWADTQNGDPYWQREARVAAYRACAATDKYPNLCTRLRWQLPLWTMSDDTAFKAAIAR
jgi:hypothetical protein